MILPPESREILSVTERAIDQSSSGPSRQCGTSGGAVTSRTSQSSLRPGRRLRPRTAGLVDAFADNSVHDLIEDEWMDELGTWVCAPIREELVKGKLPAASNAQAVRRR